MSTEKALLAAIWERPHDDTPRLVYADWLEETGAPANVARAEFIRVQCELAKLDEWDDRRPPLEKREQQLWKKYAKEWKAGLPAAVQKRAAFHRGFPAPPLRELTVGKFLAIPAEELAAAPLWSFHLPPNTRRLPDLLASANLLRVGTLDLRHWLETPEHAAGFVRSPNVRNVAGLNLGLSNLGDRGLAELAAGAAALPHLRSLDLDINHITDAGVAALAASPLLAGLQALSLYMNEKVGAAGLEALFRSPRAAELRRLNLASLELTDEAAGVIARSSPAFRLREFRLPFNRLTDDGAAALAGWPGLASVRVLDLGFNYKIGPAGVAALARSPHLEGVAKLSLRGSAADETARELARQRFGDRVLF